MIVNHFGSESHGLSHCDAGEKSRRARNSLRRNMTRLGIEPRTYGLKVRCSNQLSYRVGLSRSPRRLNLWLPRPHLKPAAATAAPTPQKY